MIGDYYSVLREAIEATGDNPADMRRVIYEVARAQLEKKLRAAHPPLSAQAIREEQDALEAAFRLIDAEAGIAEGKPPRAQPGRVASPSTDVDAAAQPFASGSQTGATTSDGFSILPPKTQPISLEPEVAATDRQSWRPGQQFRNRRIVGTLQVLLAVSVGGVVAGAGGYALMQAKSGRGEFGLPFLGRSPDQMHMDLAPGRRMDTASPADLKTEAFQHPLPTVYGVYALQNAKLTELRPATLFAEQAPGALAMVKEPSRVVLPHGQLAFIVFRRSLLSHAPERMAVSIVARVAQEATGGHASPTTAPVTNQWIIRRAVHELRVAPIKGQPEMVLVRHEQATFELTPGRYALLVADQAFDFLVAGRITDPAHCVERTHSTETIAYTDCVGGGRPSPARGGRASGP